MAIVFTITDAGRAALIDPDNNGTNAVVIAEVELGSGRYAPTKDQTELQSPIKRVDTIAGQAVSDDTIHVTVQDETGDAYQVGEIGLFTETGVLFAVHSQDEWIIEKAAPVTLLLATDLIIESLDVSSITFGDAAFLNPPASETVQGVIELATQEEVDAGKDGRRGVVPRTLKAFIDKVLKAYATVKQLTDHAASRDHPAATTSAQGMVELATYVEAKEGSDNTRAVTPAADKAALDQHRNESGAHAADRILLASLSKLGNPKTVQAGFAALGRAAVRDEGAGNGLDADRLDGLEADQFLRSDKGNTRIPFGTTSDTNWDGLVYDEGDNTVAFYADQTVGTDTPRALLGPGYIELAGRRIATSDAGVEFANALGIGVTPNGSKSFTNGSSIALGDDDSGIRGNGDGVVEVWANNKAMLTVTTSGLKVAQGALEFPGGLYAEDGSTYAINLGNGDVRGANTIYWNDTSNNAIEGVAFPRNNDATDSSHWSTLRAYNDKPYFAPNAKGDSYEMFHEGNLPERNRRDWGSWGTNGYNVITNSGRQVLYASDTEIRFGGEDFSILTMRSLAGFTKGAQFGAELNMQNNDILNANRVTINDDGSGEGFMLPSYGLVEKSGYAVLERISDGAEMWSTDGAKMNVKQTLQQSGNNVWHDGRSSFSKKSNGYSLLPNGLILQWGTASATAGRTSVKTDFPIPFPNDCLVAVGCDNEDAYPDPVGMGWTRTQISTTTDENGIVRYIAIGY